MTPYACGSADDPPRLSALRTTQSPEVPFHQPIIWQVFQKLDRFTTFFNFQVQRSSFKVAKEVISEIVTGEKFLLVQGVNGEELSRRDVLFYGSILSTEEMGLRSLRGLKELNKSKELTSRSLSNPFVEKEV